MASRVIDPRQDGISHINVYSKGATQIGRYLSNFAHIPFVHPEDGAFESVEGYWYWLGSGDDHLRTLYGHEAKQYGKHIQAEPVMTPEFKAKIYQALLAKCEQCGELKDMMITSELPFKHYYVYGGVAKTLPQYKWIMNYLEIIRNSLKLSEDSLTV